MGWWMVLETVHSLNSGVVSLVQCLIEKDCFLSRGNTLQVTMTKILV